MKRLGASVTGVDASEANIKTAMTHASEQGLDIDYRAGTAEGLIESGEPLFDIVLNLEVVEHVADPHQFLKDTGGLVKPGGLMIVATLNRTAKALATAVIGAEYVLGWLPRGTHDWSKFVTPDEADAGLTAAGLVTEPAVGVSYNPLADSWKLSGDTKVNYMIVARRPAE
nr:bifunctional 2-polyprenyl-6-hydroxyphenol methylase/3-demethylubiquinol 3-O-methyltransferase UbiG [Hyphomonas sp. UBA3592]